MSKYLITGFSGFVGHYIASYIMSAEGGAEIIAVDINPPFEKNYHGKFSFVKLDLLDKKRVGEVFNKIQPDYIIHLASLSSVRNSWIQPDMSFLKNMEMVLNIYEALRYSDFKCRILSIGSSEQYGIVGEQEIPIKETRQLNPISPYAVSKVAQEHLSQVYVKGFGLDIVLTRSFNHVGPGQPEDFVVSSLGKKILKAKNSSDNTIVAGDIEIIRDFVDVRDVSRAYYLLLKKGKTGEAYNICSGIGRSIKEIITLYCKLYNCEVRVIKDSSLIRPVDNPVITGSYEKLFQHTSWQPLIKLEDSLKESLNYKKIID
ncbi:MAG: GDP-mannose 4,6-dehydratase [Nitrospirae bacterium YQR-1]